MRWSVKFFLRNFRKKTKSTNRRRIAITARKRNEKTSRKDRLDIKRSRKIKQSIKESRKNRKKNDIRKSRKKDDIRKNRKENDIRWSWNREFHEIENRISLFFLDEKTKRHKHRNTETINNNRHKINKIIFFDKWYRWDYWRIKQSRTTNFNTSQRNFHEIVEISKNLISCERFSLLRQKKQRRQRFWSSFLKTQTKFLTKTTKKQKFRLRRKFSNEQKNVFVFFSFMMKRKRQN